MLILKSESMYLHNIFLKVSGFKSESAPNVKPCPSNFLKKLLIPFPSYRYRFPSNSPVVGFHLIDDYKGRLWVFP